MHTEGGIEHINTFNRGVAYDVDQEALGSKPEFAGLALDARNGRPTSNQGNTEAYEKIRGERILYANGTTLTGAVCAAADSINQHLVEVWVDPTTTPHTCIIRIDGIICMQTQFQFLTGEMVFNYLSCQIDKNESGKLTELFLTDNTVAPYIFDIKDMIAKQVAGSLQYFSGFDPVLYQINLQSPLDRPVFVELKNVGLGLPAGQYRYQMQYANDEGDVTNWSMATDLIPVVEGLSQSSRIYPWSKTYGGPPKPSSPTGFAIHLRFRVTNIYNYQYINIKRLSYNEGAGVTFTPNGVIVAKIPIAPGEISVRDYFDPNQSNTNIALSEAQETQQISEIKRAKAIRYFDRRTILMNVEVPSKVTTPTFLQIGGKEGFPVIEKMGQAGHKDPWNHASRRSVMRGDVEGYGVVQFDGVGTNGFVNKIPQLENFQFPNRRDPVSAETITFSIFGLPKAGLTDTASVGLCHEVFDLTSITAKSDYASFKNIIRSGAVLGLSGTKTKSQVNQTVPSPESNSQIMSHGAHVSAANLVSVSYQPYSPVRQSDQNVTGHDFVITTGAYYDDSTLCNPAYNPAGYAPNYYSMGMCVAGVDNFAPWAKAFSVVKTPSAKRVVCQGIGFYSLHQADFNFVGNKDLATKDQNRIWFYSPDVQNGLVSSDTVNDIIANPQNYTLQFVSPLGFFSEVYNMETPFFDIAKKRDGNIDMISYIRMLRDASGGNYQLNPNESANMGIDGFDGNRYVSWAKFRNQNYLADAGNFTGTPQAGNTPFGITDVERVVEGRGEYLSIGADRDIYSNTGTGGSGNNKFNDSGMQDWTEPIYIVNIVRNGEQIIDQNIQGYQQTSHYQKLSSIIGTGTGVLGQKLILVDERWEDCIPAPSSTITGANIDRFIFIKDPNTGIIQKWINVTFKTPFQIATIAADIAAFGSFTGGVTGMYTHENINNSNRFYNIVFDVAGFPAPLGQYVLVNYDNTAPIRVFGGDTFIHEAIFSPIDRVSNSEQAQAETTFQFGIGFPYHRYQQNARYYQIKRTSGVNIIETDNDPYLGYIRQLAAMFTCEARAGIHYAYNLDYPNQFFPCVDYVMRPDRWKVDSNMHDNGMWPQYEIDFPGENANWEWGGFRTLPQVNPDYSCEAPIQFFSMPEFGFVENTVFDTRIMWSLPRVIGVQDSPSLKTFPANNSFDIDDNQGEIKRAWDATTADKGENLYAFTNKGICLLVTNKSILSAVTADQLGLIESTGFVKQQYWISKDVGMFDEWWRSAAEAFVPITEEGGIEIRKQAIFWLNNESAFRFMDNQCIDIGRIDYHVRLYNDGIANVLSGFGTKVTGIFDKYYQEYSVTMQITPSPLVFAFGQKTGR